MLVEIRGKGWLADIGFGSNGLIEAISLYMLEYTSSTFGTLLKQFRKRQRLTQQQIAEVLGVHRNTIGRWEEGSFLPESKALVLDLARRLHLDEQETRQLLDTSLIAPMPIWSVPYPRNPFFTGHEETLSWLHAHLGPSQRIAHTQSYALHGLGGVGKTQLALEYAYRYALEYGAIFWIEAETVEQVHTSLLRIAERLDLPERVETDQQRVVAAVQRWLETRGEWLLIWDNLDDLDLMQRYLPTNKLGAVLITTRCQALGTKAQGIELAPMSQEEGMLFLLRRAHVLEVGATGEQVHRLAVSVPDEYAAASELVTILGRLPLALDQVGAYIEETQCGLANFLALFQRYPLQLLQERGTHAEHPASVVETFVLSFEKLQQKHRAAAELLTACCFLAPEEIPESLFSHYAMQHLPEWQKVLDDPLAFHKILRSLLAYALVQRYPARQTLAVHPLVQTVLKAQLSVEQQQEWLARLIKLLAHAFPQDVKAVETWPWCEQLLPHALHCLVQMERSECHSPEFCLLLTQTAAYLFQRVQLSIAEALF